jgi:hypothetical protein
MNRCDGKKIPHHIASGAEGGALEPGEQFHARQPCRESMIRSIERVLARRPDPRFGRRTNGRRNVRDTRAKAFHKHDRGLDGVIRIIDVLDQHRLGCQFSVKVGREPEHAIEDGRQCERLLRTIDPLPGSLACRIDLERNPVRFDERCAHVGPLGQRPVGDHRDRNPQRREPVNLLTGIAIECRLAVWNKGEVVDALVLSAKLFVAFVTLSYDEVRRGISPARFPRDACDCVRR